MTPQIQPATALSPQDMFLLHAKVLESMAEGVSVSDEEGFILYTNPAENEMFGYEPGELTGRHVTALNAYPPEENQRRVAEVIEQLRTKGVWRGEWFNRRKDGAPFYTNARITSIELGDRKFWICVQEDVTEQKRASAAGRHLAAIVESSDDVIISKDLNGVITSWNGGAEKILGYRAEEVIGQHISMLLPPGRAPEVPVILDRISRGERIHHFETENRTKDGRILTVSLTISPVRNADGEIVGASKIARDITDRKRMEEALRTRELEWRTLLSSLPDIVSRFDSNFRFLYVNPAVARFTGYDPTHFLGKTHSEAGVPQPLSEQLEASLREIYRSGEVQIVNFEFLSPGLGLRHMYGIGVPEFAPDGSVKSAMTIVCDLTEQKRSEAAHQAIERELMLLVEASAKLLSSPHSADVLRTIVELAQRFIAADAYAVWRVHDNREAWKIHSSAGLSAGFLGEVFRNSGFVFPAGPMVFEDVAAEPTLEKRRESLQAEGIVSMVAVPLRIHGEPSGTVVFYWRSKHVFSEPERRIAAALGNLAAAALGTADLYQRETESRARAERSEREASFLAEAGALLSSSLDYQTTLKNVAKLAVPHVADWCSVDVLSREGQIQRVAVEHVNPEKVLLAYEYSEKFPQQDDDLGRVALRTGKSVLLEEIPWSMVLERVHSPEQLEYIQRLELSSLIIAPMVLGGETLGIITFVNGESGRRFTPADLRMTEEIARRAASAIAHARLYEDVRASEERLRLAVSAAGLGIWERDLKTNKLSTSRQFRMNVGAGPDQDLDYSALQKLIHPDDFERWRETSERAVAEKSGFSLECRFRAADGGIRWVAAYGRCLCNEEGEPTRSVGVTLDITGRKEAEQERVRLLGLEKQARRDAELLNGIGPLLLSELDSDKLIQKVTGIATSLIGAQFAAFLYRKPDADGGASEVYTRRRPSRELPGGLPAGLNAIAEAAFGEDRVIRREDLHDDPTYEPGQPRSGLAMPVKSRAGEVFGALVFGHNDPGAFTPQHQHVVAGIAAQAGIALDNARLFEESKRAQEAMRRSNEELRRANEDLNQFAYSASHDLQEPLRMVAVYTQMLERKYKGQLDERADEFIDFAVRGAKRMELLLRDLLAYTQAASLTGGEIAPVDGAAILREVLQNLKPAIEAAHATLEYDTLPSLRIQPVHLTQLFQNLISNALKYRNPGGSVAVTVRCVADGAWWRICVSDTGIGIPQQYVQQIFGIFKRLHSGDEYPGTGIGLAICQRIVERYGGRIWAESEVGQGSKFYFTLPRD